MRKDSARVETSGLELFYIPYVFLVSKQLAQLILFVYLFLLRCDSFLFCILTTLSALPSCYGGEFQCDNGKCISREFVCDGEMDCGFNDAADEINCGKF